MQDRLRFLAEMPVFGGLDDPSLEILADPANTVRIAGGQHFIREGGQTQAMYVLLSGRVEVYKSWHGEAKLLRWMEPGDCFGEMALLDLFPRSASALATEDSEALEITPVHLQRVHNRNPEQYTLLQMNMAREISRRLRRVDDLLFRALMGEALPETTFQDVE